MNQTCRLPLDWQLGQVRQGLGEHPADVSAQMSKCLASVYPRTKQSLIIGVPFDVVSTAKTMPSICGAKWPALMKIGQSVRSL